MISELLEKNLQVKKKILCYVIIVFLKKLNEHFFFPYPIGKFILLIASDSVIIFVF